MRKVLALGCAFGLVGVVAAALGQTSCSSTHTTDGWTDAQWAQLNTLSPLPAVLAPDTTNKYADNAAAAALGQQFFYDKAFAGPIIVGSDTPLGGDAGANGKKGETGKVACANCHQPANQYMFDTRSTPNMTTIGTQWMIRNASTTLNTSFYKVWCEKDGVRDTQWSDGLTDPEDPTSMDSNRNRVAHIIYAKYKDAYNAVFTDHPLDPALDLVTGDLKRFPLDATPVNAGSDVLNGTNQGHFDNTAWGTNWNNMAPADQQIVMRIFANFGKAIQAFLRLNVSRNAPFDRYMAGDYTQLSASAKAGLGLFIGKAGCVNCHSGPLFSDSKFHNTGLAASGVHIAPDETGRYDAIPAVLSGEFNSNTVFSDDQNSGRLTDDAGEITDLDAAATPDPVTIGQWRTTQLRNVGKTAPYMHTGQLATLTEVVQFYNLVGAAGQFDPDGGNPTCPQSPPAAGLPPHPPCAYGTIDKLMQPLNLSDGEVQNIVDFLNALTGDPIPANLGMDTSLPGTGLPEADAAPPVDGGSPDSGGTADSGAADSGAADTGAADSGSGDSGSGDSGSTDAQGD